jgi:hypothetical protein
MHNSSWKFRCDHRCATAVEIITAGVTVRESLRECENEEMLPVEMLVIRIRVDCEGSEVRSTGSVDFELVRHSPLLPRCEEDTENEGRKQFEFA